MKWVKSVFFATITVLILWWLTLSHVTFNLATQEYKRFTNKEYTVIFFKPLLTNPIGLYYRLVYRFPFYAVLYDKDGSYIGQSSPFFMNSDIYLLGDDFSFPHSSTYHTIRDSFYLIENDNYTISVTEKSWWSWLLQHCHQKKDVVKA